MDLIAIDPGLTYGIAVFRDGMLDAAGQQPLTTGFASFVPGPIVVVERPHIQKGRGASADSVVTLGLEAGWLARTYAKRWDDVRWVRPIEWKGTIPKPKRKSDPYLIVARAKAKLLPKEVAIAPPDDQWDAWDAIGLGLYALGRCRTGVV